MVKADVRTRFTATTVIFFLSLFSFKELERCFFNQICSQIDFGQQAKTLTPTHALSWALHLAIIISPQITLFAFCLLLPPNPMCVGGRGGKERKKKKKKKKEKKKKKKKGEKKKKKKESKKGEEITLGVT